MTGVLHVTPDAPAMSLARRLMLEELAKADTDKDEDSEKKKE